MSQQDRTFGHTITTWTLAVLCLATATALGWLWLDLTLSARECATGSGHDQLGIVGFVALWIAPVIVTSWREHRVGATDGAAMAAFLAGPVLLLLTYWAWWYAHNCMT